MPVGIDRENHMKAEIVKITPVTAEMWLKTSEGNPRFKTGRFVNRKKVDKIKSDILRGEWNPGPSSIAFDENMRLVDGHHRLTAIKEAGIPVESLVVFGVKKSGLAHIDENSPRTVSQRTGLNFLIPGVANLDFMSINDCAYVEQSAESIMAW